ncbi:hypothetical protein RJT34_18228 [Clitoria ternatea]|uniref:Uncharacterized protein n=1 Tax=Clitoria ternatea TaxID=43366 RepID=A0AAN9PFL9_CLITE
MVRCSMDMRTNMAEGVIISSYVGPLSKHDEICSSMVYIFGVAAVLVTPKFNLVIANWDFIVIKLVWRNE